VLLMEKEIPMADWRKDKSGIWRHPNFGTKYWDPRPDEEKSPAQRIVEKHMREHGKRTLKRAVERGEKVNR